MLVIAGVLLLSACATSGGDRASGPSTSARDRTTTSTGSHPSTTASSRTTASTTTTIASTTTTTTAPKPVPTTTTAPPLPPEVGNLAAGSVGSRTQAVQAALHDQKYDPGPADGKFGLKTTQSVWAWQALHGLPRTGVLTAGHGAAGPGRQAQAMLRPDLGPTHSEVDLARQVLLVFQDGKPELITHVSTGSGRHYCDRGNCGTRDHHRGLVPLSTPGQGMATRPASDCSTTPIYFNGGIAVHGAPSVPNYPASHGCVRIPMHIAEYYPGLVANGEPIVVI